MNIPKNSLMLAAIAVFGMAASSCVTEDSVEAHASVPGTYSNYTVTMGDGYAGRGYYYGPPNTTYYSREPGVTYYSTRESVPQQYWSSNTSYGAGSNTTVRREVRTTSTGSTMGAPTTTYTVTEADGYAGRGYYYGPPNVRYYDQSPGVTYYRDRASVPSQYWGGASVRIGN